MNVNEFTHEWYGYAADNEACRQDYERSLDKHRKHVPPRAWSMRQVYAFYANAAPIRGNRIVRRVAASSVTRRDTMRGAANSGTAPRTFAGTRDGSSPATDCEVTG